MKKQITFAIAAMLMLASCSEKMANNPAAQGEDNGTISFKTFVDNNTKGRPHEGTELKQDFGVFAYLDSERKHERHNLCADFMYLQKIDYNSHSHDFTYSPLKFWPERGCVDFYAWTPYWSDDIRWCPKNHGEKGVPEIEYTVDGDLCNHEDFMVSEALDQDGDKPCVNFNFKHALTKVGVVAHLDTDCEGDGIVVKIKEVKFEDLYYKGKFSYARYEQECGKWWEVETGRKCNYEMCIDEPGGIIVLYSDNHDWRHHTSVNKEDGYILAMPQTLNNNAKLCVKYDIIMNGQTINRDQSVYLRDGRATWKPGECIIYDICISINAIGFDAHVSDWDDCITVDKQIVP